MVFNSLSFLAFFAVVTPVYFLLPHRWRWVHLLAASCVFYAAFVPVYLLILAGLVGVDYVAGRVIAATTGRRRTAALAISLTANVGVLCLFKYLPALAVGSAAVANRLGWAVGPVPAWATTILLPIGLSFHTFQAMAYTVDVYRGHAPAERHLGIYALYVMFYPQLVAGPIERPNQLIPQFRHVHRFDADRLAAGLTRMTWGLFKKVAVADRLAPVVDAAYAHPAAAGRGHLVLATYAFAVQVYCDFSGYCDVALGAAHAMGFDLMENFDRPYLAASVGEFWRRWHRSLSYWFRDYVYIPLGGSRVPPLQRALNVLLVFALSGIWHGAGLAFLTWGLLHGAYILGERWSAPARDRLAARLGLGAAARRAVGVAVTFHLVCFAWVFFRAGTLADGWAVVRGMVGPPHGHGGGFDRGALAVTVALVAVGGLVQWARGGRRVDQLAAAVPAWVRWAALYGIVLVILWVGVLGQRTFIYFQF